MKNPSGIALWCHFKDSRFS